MPAHYSLIGLVFMDALKPYIFLLISIAVSSAYWSIYRKRALDTLAPVKRAIASLTKIQTLLLIALILFSLYLFSREQEVYDSLVYHHQNIRWNEEYAVVPGLGNLDDKFGFNSNYFLLSSIFTFRFLFGEAIYPVQSFFVTAISCWVLYELFKSNYEIKRVVVLISYILLFWVSIYFLGNTSTDILPNFIVFYIIARLILHPKSLTTNNIIGKTISFLFVTGIIMWNSYNLYSFSSQTYNSNIISHIAYKPYSVIDRKRIQGIEIEKDFTEYPLNNGVTILVNSGFSYDIFPSTIHSTYAKFLPIDCLETRGNSFQDGFRTKKGCK
ncbi:hypothetical protein FACS1894179_10640 [Bacteroidia bacterium]|nr:hypothetical protein FACS1894179_10640 [Bacteroidia bacterium]